MERVRGKNEELVYKIPAFNSSEQSGIFSNYSQNHVFKRQKFFQVVPSPVLLCPLCRFRTAPFRAPHLSRTACGERFATPQPFTLSAILPHTSLFIVFVTACVFAGNKIVHSTAISSSKTLTFLSAKFAFHVCFFAWISMAIRQIK